MAIRFSCKRCAFSIKAEGNAAGKKAKCPNCGKVEIVPEIIDKIRFQCQNCGQKISVSQVHAGKKGKCPKCQNIVIIPEQKQAPTELTTLNKPTQLCTFQNKYHQNSEEIDHFSIFGLITHVLPVLSLCLFIVAIILWKMWSPIVSLALPTISPPPNFNFNFSNSSVSKDNP